MRIFLSAVALASILITGCEKTKNQDRKYEVNTTTSVVEWKGSAPDHFHVGSFDVNGTLRTASDGRIKEGKFVIPISSIKDFDLPEDLKVQLLTHLKSPDFFNMALHPNAGFEITKIENYSGHAGIPDANKMVTGNFSMTGQTHPITFPAKIYYTGDSLKVQAILKVDRSKWGMTKYTDQTAPDYIIPDADITLKIQAGLK